MTRGPLLPITNRRNLAFIRGAGAWLYTEDGDPYLDFASGTAVNALGHAHPHLVEQLKAQVERLWHVSNLVRIPEGERLGQRLVESTFADVVFFANSGAEANEAAIKIARKFHSSNGQPERFRIITFEGAFHGRTLATIAATGYARYLEGFGPPVDGFDQVELGDWQGLVSAITHETAAIMLEPIQGEGGLRVVSPAMLRRIRQLADERGLLLILDEVQSGVGRAGCFFAHERAGITPDIMTVAKGLGGGFPIGACLATSRAAKGMTVGTHGTTFGGNPLAMAAGNAVLDVILDPEFLPRVEKAGELLRVHLEQISSKYDDLFIEQRGAGLLRGLQTRGNSERLVEALEDERLIALSARNNVVRFAPPLIVSADEIAEAATRIDAACAKLRTSAY